MFRASLISAGGFGYYPLVMARRVWQQCRQKISQIAKMAIYLYFDVRLFVWDRFCLQFFYGTVLVWSWFNMRLFDLVCGHFEMELFWLGLIWLLRIRTDLLWDCFGLKLSLFRAAVLRWDCFWIEIILIRALLKWDCFGLGLFWNGTDLMWDCFGLKLTAFVWDCFEMGLFWLGLILCGTVFDWNYIF